MSSSDKGVGLLVPEKDNGGHDKGRRLHPECQGLPDDDPSLSD